MPRLIFALILGIVCGCAPSSSRNGATADVAVTEDTEAMVGKWGVEGEVFLIVSHVGDRIVLAAPENDTWRMDISDARLDGDSICYIQKYFLHSGEYHPFNGVKCNTRIRLIDADTMEMTLRTVHSPDLDAERLVRIK